MLLSILLIFTVSCNNNNEPSDDTVNNTSEVVETSLEDVINGIDLGGAEISFLVPLSNMHEIYTSVEIAVDELNGSRINDTVYNRNTMIEQKHNVKISAFHEEEVVTTARALAMAGDDDHQVYMPYLNSSVPLMHEGLLSDLYKYEHLNLYEPYWDQNARDSLTIGGKLYFATGDISIIDDYCTMTMYFNKRLIREHNLDDPYQLVKDYKYTLDKVFEYGKVYNDLDGSGTVNNEMDLFGIGLTNPVFFWYGGGMSIASRDADGNVTVNLESDEHANFITKLLDYYHSSEPGVSWTSWAEVKKTFAENRIVMFTSVLGNLTLELYKMEDVEFGLLPMPLKDESQSAYHTLVSTGLVPVVTIPMHLDTETAEKAAAACELLAYYSADTLRHEYYDITLHDRYFDDSESGEMLDIIFGSRVYDLGYIYNWGKINSVLANMKTNDTFFSEYAAIKNVIDAEINETIKQAELNN